MTRSSRFHISDEKLAKAEKLRAQGVEDEDIAERLGVNRNTMQDRLLRRKRETRQPDGLGE
jgi:orotate phosphoribosyltransferase-like protein